MVDNDVDFPIRRLIGQHALQKTAKLLPLLGCGELAGDLARADCKGGKKMPRPMTLVSAF